MLVTRRDFLLSTASTIGSLTAWPRWPLGVHAEPLRIGLVSADASAQTMLGARLGAEEASHAATLFGTAVEMVTAAEPRELLDARVAVLVGGANDDVAEQLSALAERSGVLFLNVASTSDTLRADHCRAHTFHLTASAAMRQATRAASDAADSEVRLWHESLVQFGAAQLNDRFRVHFSTAMTDDAWTAWMAIKVASEAALRMRSVTPASLTTYLTRPGIRFDGHKGRPLSFGVADHQLRQPLYRVRLGANGVATAEEIRATEPATASGATCGSGQP